MPDPVTTLLDLTSTALVDTLDAVLAADQLAARRVLTHAGRRRRAGATAAAVGADPTLVAAARRIDELTDLLARDLLARPFSGPLPLHDRWAAERLRDAGAVRLRQLGVPALVAPSRDPAYRQAGVALREVAWAGPEPRSQVLVLCAAIATGLLGASARRSSVRSSPRGVRIASTTPRRPGRAT